MYEHIHRKPMSASALAQLLGNNLYYKRFFPYFTWNLCVGLDPEGTIKPASHALFPLLLSQTSSSLWNLVDHQAAFSVPLDLVTSHRKRCRYVFVVDHNLTPYHSQHKETRHTAHPHAQ